MENEDLLTSEAPAKIDLTSLLIDPVGYNPARIVEKFSNNGIEFEAGTIVYQLSEEVLRSDQKKILVSIFSKCTSDQNEQHYFIMNIKNYFEDSERMKVESLVLDQSWRFHFIPKEYVILIQIDELLINMRHCLENCNNEIHWNEIKPIFNFFGLVETQLLVPIFNTMLEALTKMVKKVSRSYHLSLKTRRTPYGSTIQKFCNDGSERLAFCISSDCITPVYGILEPNSSTPLEISIDLAKEDNLTVKIVVIPSEADNAEEKSIWNDSAITLSKIYALIATNNHNVSWKWEAIQEFGTKLNRLLEVLDTLRILRQKFTFSQELIKILSEILQIVKEQLEQWRCLNLSTDQISVGENKIKQLELFCTTQQLSEKNTNMKTILEMISNEVILRNSVTRHIDHYWGLFMNEEHSEDKGFIHFQFFSLYWPTNYPELVFYHLLNTLSKNRNQIGSYAKNFIKIILTEPSILRALGDKSFKEDFLMNFDYLIRENNVLRPERIAGHSSFWEVFFHDSSIANFLRAFYQAGRTRESLYFKQRCFASLLKYSFDEIQEKFPCRLERVILTKTDEGLTEYILNSFRTEEVHLVSTLADLISNEHRAKVFMTTIKSIIDDKVKEVDGSIVFKHSGIVWYSLFSLRECQNLISVVKSPDNIEILGEYFRNSVDSMIPLPNLERYYEKLKKIIFEQNTDKCSKIQEKLADRKKVERRFAEEFYLNIYSYEMRMPRKKDSNFIELLKYVAEFPYVFIRIFLDRLINIGNIFSKSPRRMTIMDKIDDFFKLTFAQYHEREIIGKTIFGQFNKETFETVQAMSLGKSPRTHLATVPKFVTPIIYKQFTQEMFDQILEEMDHLIRLQAHPNIVHVYGYVVDKGFYTGILMEFCRGGSLCKYIEDMNNQYTEKDVISWIAQVACGISYLHENNIVHRNIKPDNILIEEDLAIIDDKRVAPKIIKVTDIGSAIMTTKTEDETDDASSEALNYRAPEAGDPENYTPAMDIFSIGRTIWYICYRRKPNDKLCQDVELKSVVTLSENHFILMKRMMIPEAHERPRASSVLSSFQKSIDS